MKAVPCVNLDYTQNTRHCTPFKSVNLESIYYLFDNSKIMSKLKINNYDFQGGASCQVR